MKKVIIVMLCLGVSILSCKKCKKYIDTHFQIWSIGKVDMDDKSLHALAREVEQRCVCQPDSIKVGKYTFYIEIIDSTKIEIQNNIFSPPVRNEELSFYKLPK
jgi:hypothetical protein